MKSPHICALRSVALTVPDLDAAERFYTEVWKLAVADRSHGALYLRGSGSDHHLLELRQAEGTPQLLRVTLRARSQDDLERIATTTTRAGGSIEHGPGATQDPA